MANNLSVEKNLTHDCYAVLDAICKHKKPIGANTLSLDLGIPLATVGRILQKLEYFGYLTRVGNKGRVITAEGIAQLREYENEQYSSKSIDELKEFIFCADKQSLLEVLAVRRLLELEIIENVCKRITPPDIEKLLSIVELEDAAKKGDRIASKENLNFHMELARIGGNHLAYQILSLLMCQNQAYVHSSIIYRVSGYVNNATHRQIVDAIERRDISTAKELMDAHISFVIQHVQKNY